MDMQAPQMSAIESEVPFHSALDQAAAFKNMAQVMQFVKTHLNAKYRELFNDIAGDDINDESFTGYLGYAALVLEAMQNKKVNQILNEKYYPIYEQALKRQEAILGGDSFGDTLFDLITFLHFLQSPTPEEKALADGLNSIIFSQDLQDILLSKQLTKAEIAKLEGIINTITNLEVSNFQVIINDYVIKNSESHDQIADINDVLSKQTRVKSLYLEFGFGHELTLKLEYDNVTKQFSFLLTSASKLNQENKVESAFVLEGDRGQYIVTLKPLPKAK
jgi:hypothetical protein